MSRQRLSSAARVADPWGNGLELNCYGDQRVKTDLVDAAGVIPVRYWARELYNRYKSENA